MKKKFMLMATTLLISSLCLYGCGEDKNNKDTTVEQTEVVEVQDQVENEEVGSLGNFASKNYKYNHVFDDIINEALVINAEYLDMTSCDQVMAKYGGTGEGGNHGELKYVLDLGLADELFVLLEPKADDTLINEYILSSMTAGVVDQLITSESKWDIDENFSNESCDYLSIAGGEYNKYLKRNTDRYIEYPSNESSNRRKVLGHTYEEIVEVLGNKGMLFRLYGDKISVVWVYRDTDSGNADIVYLTFNASTQLCVEVGY